MRLMAPTLAPDFDLRDISGKRRRLRYLRGRRVMLSFFSSVACPRSTLRLPELSRHYEAWKDDGLEIIAFVTSSAADICDQAAMHPLLFPLVADEEMTIYERYGVEDSSRRMLHMPRMLRAMFKDFISRTRGAQRLLPADFLIDEEGIIRLVYYGGDMGDHMPMDAIREFITEGKKRLGSSPKTQYFVAQLNQGGAHGYTPDFFASGKGMHHGWWRARCRLTE